jgi:hypothetical protein
MELTLDANEDAVFIGVRMTGDGLETSIFNMNFSTDDNRTCSIMALGAASCIVNDAEHIEEKGIAEFIKFSDEVSSKEEKGGKKGVPTKGNVINFSEEAEKRKDT